PSPPVGNRPGGWWRRLAGAGLRGNSLIRAFRWTNSPTTKTDDPAPSGDASPVRGLGRAEPGARGRAGPRHGLELRLRSAPARDRRRSLRSAADRPDRD